MAHVWFSYIFKTVFMKAKKIENFRNQEVNKEGMFLVNGGDSGIRMSITTSTITTDNCSCNEMFPGGYLHFVPGCNAGDTVFEFHFVY